MGPVSPDSVSGYWGVTKGWQRAGILTVGAHARLRYRGRAPCMDGASHTSLHPSRPSLSFVLPTDCKRVISGSPWGKKCTGKGERRRVLHSPGDDRTSHGEKRAKNVSIGQSGRRWRENYDSGVQRLRDVTFTYPPTHPSIHHPHPPAQR